MHIGIAGVGRMGANMGLRLIETGNKLTVWNRSAEKIKPLADAGAAVAKTPAELAAAVEAVITILTNAAAIDEVYHGPQGLLSGDVKGKLFIEMSTVPPEVAGRARREGARQGRGLRRMPGRRQHRAGAAGQAARQHGRGARRCRARATDPRSALPARQHAGPVGTGAVLKLAVNLPLMIYWQALGEQLAVCKELKIDPAELLDFLSETSGAATVLKQRMEGIVAKLKDKPWNISTFTLDNGIKDVNAMLEQGRSSGCRIAAAAADAGLLRRGAAQHVGRRRSLRSSRCIGRARDKQKVGEEFPCR